MTDGWRLVLKAVQLVVNNLVMAVVFSLPYVLGSVALARATVTVVDVDTGAFAVGPFLLLLVAFVLLFLWTAVSWHRYILLEEVPGHSAPLVSWGPMFGYLGKIIVFALLSIPAMMVLSGFFLSQLSSVMTTTLGSTIVLTLVGMVFMYVFFRLSPVLPAAALEIPMRIGQAWGLTSAHGGAIYGVVLFTGAMSLLSQGFAALPHGPITWVLTIVVQWLNLMIGLSLLTTLYGHIVEERPLD